MRLSSDHHGGLLLAFQCQRVADGRALADGPRTLEEQAATVGREWESALSAHFQDEEERLVPVLGARVSPPLLERLAADHAAIDAARQEVARARGPALAAALRRFGQLLDAHVRFEERELFPAIEGALTEAEKATLEAAMPHAPGCRVPDPHH